MDLPSRPSTGSARSNVEDGVFRQWCRRINHYFGRSPWGNDSTGILPGPTSGTPTHQEIRSRRRNFALLQNIYSFLSVVRRRIRHIVPPGLQFRVTVSTLKGAEAAWRVFDTVFLLGLGTGYINRFEEFATVSEGEGCDALIREWRDEQQEEWNRLSTTLAILGTMHAAILAITPSAPPLAFSLWIGGVSMSVCGLFIVQYFPLKAFAIRDMDMPLLLGNSDMGGNMSLVSSTLVIIAVSSPPAMLMWTTLLFVVGMLVYVAEVDMLHGVFRWIAAIPLGIGVLFMVLTVGLGEMIERRLREKNKKID